MLFHRGSRCAPVHVPLTRELQDRPKHLVVRRDCHRAEIMCQHVTGHKAEMLPEACRASSLIACVWESDGWDVWRGGGRIIAVG